MVWIRTFCDGCHSGNFTQYGNTGGDTNVTAAKRNFTMTLTLNPERELTTRAAPDMLQDNELDIVSGGDSRTDPGDDDDKMSGGELAVILLGVGAVKGILY